MASGRLIWAHQDSVSLNESALRAYECARADSWPGGAEGNRLFRAWLVSLAHVMGQLGPMPTMLQAEGPSAADGMGLSGTQYLVQPMSSREPVRFDWQNCLSTALAALASQGKLSKADLLLPEGKRVRIVTQDGEDPRGIDPSIETAAIGVVAGIVIVACTGLLAGALGWIVAQRTELSALEATAKSKASIAIGAMTTAAQVIENHMAQEAKHTQSLSWTAEELNVLGALRDTIHTTAGWEPPALKSVPNATVLGGAGIGIGTAIALALAAWLFLQSNK